MFLVSAATFHSPEFKGLPQTGKLEALPAKSDNLIIGRDNTDLMRYTIQVSIAHQ